MSGAYPGGRDATQLAEHAIFGTRWDHFAETAPRKGAAPVRIEAVASAAL